MLDKHEITTFLLGIDSQLMTKKRVPIILLGDVVKVLIGLRDECTHVSMHIEQKDYNKVIILYETLKSNFDVELHTYSEGEIYDINLPQDILKNAKAMATKHKFERIRLFILNAYDRLILAINKWDQNSIYDAERILDVETIDLMKLEQRIQRCKIKDPYRFMKNMEDLVNRYGKKFKKKRGFF